MRKTILILFCLLVVLPLINSSPEDGLIINFDVIPYGLVEYELHPFDEFLKEYNVVGDSFYYDIEIIANEEISDDLIIEVIAPNNQTIHKTNLNLNLKKGENMSFIPSGGVNNSYLALPFDVSGDYEIRVCSKKEITFYRKYIIWQGNSGFTTYIWYPKCIGYFFDVIPQWQYKLNEENKEAINSNQQLNRDMITLTGWIIFLTIALLTLEIIHLLSTKSGRKSFYTFLLLIPSLFILGISITFLWFSIKYGENLFLIIGGILIILGIWLLFKTLKDMKEVFLEKTQRKPTKSS